MIELKFTIKEKPDGSVLVHTQSISIGTTREVLHSLAITKAAEKACKMLVEATGGHQKMLHSVHKIAPVGEG